MFEYTVPPGPLQLIRNWAVPVNAALMVSVVEPLVWLSVENVPAAVVQDVAFVELQVTFTTPPGVVEEGEIDKYAVGTGSSGSIPRL